MWFVEAGTAPLLWNAGDVELEEGSSLAGIEQLPPDLPLGYHWLIPHDGWPPVRLVVTPKRCPKATRRWGVAAQLYAARSSHSWGIGDLGDLQRLARAVDGFVLSSPLHGGPPVAPMQSSPYYSSSRLFRDVLLLDVAAVARAEPGADVVAEVVAKAAQAGQALNARRLIDRDEVLTHKMAALEALYRAVAPRLDVSADFASYRRDAGEPLQHFASYCALAEEHGRSWTRWPVKLRRPGTAEVAAALEPQRDRAQFHQWCQWQLDRQLRAAGAAGHGVVGDLAVGFDPSGFDAWLFQEELALQARIGAPPDGFNTAGQDWGLPPFVPWKLRAVRYEPFIQTLRAGFRHMQGLRIDHVLGLFRLYVIPNGHSAIEGTYVRYPHDDLFDLLALEATRAGALVLGEDLGTVEPEVPITLAQRQVIGSTVTIFEDEGPAFYPEQKLATLTTHDLPTVAGAWTGVDQEHRIRLGLSGPSDGFEVDQFAERLAAAAGVDRGTPVDELIVASHRALAESPAMLVAATLDDLVGSTDPPNIPGTLDEWPNWRLALPVVVDGLATHPLAVRVLSALHEARPQEGPLSTPTDRYRATDVDRRDSALGGADQLLDRGPSGAGG